MALEQCHYTYAAYVCHYIAFLDFLIDTEQDVELLVNKGIYIAFKKASSTLIHDILIYKHYTYEY